MMNLYRNEAKNRQDIGLPPLPLSPEQTREVTLLLEQGNSESSFLLGLLESRVEPGVSKSAEVKASWLKDVAIGRLTVDVIDRELAVSMLAEMGGGYNVAALVELLAVDSLASFCIRPISFP